MKRRYLLVLSAAFGCGSSATSPPARGDAGTSDAGGRDAVAPRDAGPSPHDARSDGAAEGGADAPATCPTARPGVGPVHGVSSGATCAYLGIPYAAPPTGGLRWKAPQPAASWTTARTSQFASGCPQGSSTFGTPSTDEDCLYLNVWAPAVPAKTAAPVMVFVHGGTFEYGSGSFELYDGTKLAAATGNVVVTINYRLGALGFLSNPDLRAEDPAHASAGNYGIEDQAAAFAWVRANIAAFGGDAANVTVFGESAGGTSMLVHLASPKSAGLFDHMLIESAYAPNRTGAGAQSQADQVGALYATTLGCTDPGMLACLRGKSVSDVLSASDNLKSPFVFSWFPVVDGFVLPDFPMKLITSGSFAKVPTALGTNKDEGSLFVLEAPPTDAASYLAVAELNFPGNGAAVVAQYPPSAYAGSFSSAAAAALTDGAFVCPARQVARSVVAAGSPAFRYDFIHAITFPVPGLGAFHGSELMFVFGNQFEGLATLQPAELPLSADMMGYWGAMAAKGDPNGGARAAWPTYDSTTEPDLVLDLTLSTESALKRAACDFWDGLP